MRVQLQIKLRCEKNMSLDLEQKRDKTNQTALARFHMGGTMKTNLLFARATTSHLQGIKKDVTIPLSRHPVRFR